MLTERSHITDGSIYRYLINLGYHKEEGPWIENFLWKEQGI